MSEQYDIQNDSQKKASQATEASVLANKKTRKVAHRLNNVLGIMRGNIEMLEASESSLSEKSQLRLEKVNAAIDEAADLVSEIFEFEAQMEDKLQKAIQASSEKSSSGG